MPSLFVVLIGLEVIECKYLRYFGFFAEDLTVGILLVVQEPD
jgi:hypothetical protein